MQTGASSFTPQLAEPGFKWRISGEYCMQSLEGAGVYLRKSYLVVEQ